MNHVWNVWIFTFNILASGAFEGNKTNLRPRNSWVEEKCYFDIVLKKMFIHSENTDKSDTAQRQPANNICKVLPVTAKSGPCHPPVNAGKLQ